MVRSPHAHARILSIDTQERWRRPASLAVLTGADMLADGLKPIPHHVFAVHPADIRMANKDGSPIFDAPHYPLAPDKVRYVGEAVAMVIAETVRGREGRRGARRRRLRGAARRHRYGRSRAARRAARVGRAHVERVPRCGSGRPRSDRSRFRARGAHRQVRDVGAARDRRSDGAARRGLRVRSRDTALHALRRQRRRGAPEARPRADARRARDETCASSCTTSAAISARAA